MCQGLDHESIAGFLCNASECRCQTLNISNKLLNFQKKSLYYLVVVDCTGHKYLISDNSRLSEYNHYLAVLLLLDTGKLQE